MLGYPSDVTPLLRYGDDPRPPPPSSLLNSPRHRLNRVSGRQSAVRVQRPHRKGATDQNADVSKVKTKSAKWNQAWSDRLINQTGGLWKLFREYVLLYRKICIWVALTANNMRPHLAYDTRHNMQRRRSVAKLNNPLEAVCSFKKRCIHAGEAGNIIC